MSNKTESEDESEDEDSIGMMKINNCIFLFKADLCFCYCRYNISTTSCVDLSIEFYIKVVTRSMKKLKTFFYITGETKI